MSGLSGLTVVEGRALEMPSDGLRGREDKYRENVDLGYDERGRSV
jgi:hypothetical protein